MKQKPFVRHSRAVTFGQQSQIDSSPNLGTVCSYESTKFENVQSDFKLRGRKIKSDKENWTDF